MKHVGYEPQIAALQQRLERLERAQRRWRWLGVLALSALGLVLLGGASGRGERPPADEIQTQALVLVDRSGRPVARLGRLKHGGFGLGVYDARQKSRLILSAEPDGAAALRLFGPDGRGSLLLTTQADGASALRLLDQNWRVRSSLAIWPDGSPYLQLADREGQDRAILGYTELRVTGAGTIRRRPASSLVFLDPDGTVVWRAP